MLLLLQGNSRWRYYVPPTRIEKQKETEPERKRPDILPVIMHLQHSQIYELENVENDTL